MKHSLKNQSSMKYARVLGVLAAVVSANTAHAQVPEAGAAGFSMAGNYTAAARGFDAIRYNPANLAIGESKSFGLSLLSASVNSGINPIKFSDFKANQNTLVPVSTRERWLQQIGSGREEGGTDAELSLVAFNIKNFGAQVGVVGGGEVNLNQDAAEAILFGNAGRTGSAKSFNFSGSNANGSLFGVGAVSLGIPVSKNRNGDQVAFGVTAKYIRGIAAARASDNGSTTTPDDITVECPAIYTDSTHVGNAGSGFGVDLGLSWAKAGMTYSVTARNVVNSFKWSTDAFTARPGGFRFDGTNNNSNFDEVPYGQAPATMRADFEAEKFKPEIAAGVARRSGDLLLTLDGSQRLGDGINLSPKMHVGVGAEYAGLSVLTLRAGAAAITNGYQAAAGFGLRAGGMEISVGAMTRSVSGKGETGFVLNLLSTR
ncbi:MAG: DUF5723 family protein [Gemmatimonadaceae bacterium]